MFDFAYASERVRRVVLLAEHEARILNHNYVGTEHLLLGLIREGEGGAAKVLKLFGLSLEAVRAEVESVIGQGQQAPTGHIPFTPRAKNVLELSMHEALQLNYPYIGTEHLLFGLIREGEGVGVQVLMKLVGDDLEAVRKRVSDQLAGYSAAADPGVSDMLGEPPVIVFTVGYGKGSDKVTTFTASFPDGLAVRRVTVHLESPDGRQGSFTRTV